MEGWIKLHRKLCENPLWTCEPFTRGQAWVDMIILANHKDSFFYKRNIKINVLRGQIARSEVELSDRWKWSRSKVRKFLNDLEKEQQIEQQKTNVTQIVTILSYDIYQKKEQQDVQQQDSKRTAKEQQQDTYKNDNNEKNEKECERDNSHSPIKSFEHNINISEIFDHLNTVDIETLARICQISKSEVEKKLNIFAEEKKFSGKNYANEEDMKSHILSWMKKNNATKPGRKETPGQHHRVDDKKERNW